MLYVETTQYQFRKLFDHRSDNSIPTEDTLIQIQPSQIQILKKSLTNFYTQYDVLNGNFLMNKLNRFIDKLFQNIFSIDILKEVYKNAHILIQKLTKYQNYINEQNQIFEQESLCNLSKFSAEDSRIFDDNNIQNSFAKRNSFYINSSLMSPTVQKHTLDKEIGNQVDFNFYQPLNHDTEQWNDNFIEKKLKQCSQSQKKSSQKIIKCETQENTFSNVFFHQLSINKAMEISIMNAKNPKEQQKTQQIQQIQQKDSGNVIISSILQNQKENIETYESQSEITEWGNHNTFQYFNNDKTIKDILIEEAEADINRKKQLLDQQSKSSDKKFDYQKILRKLRAKAKRNSHKIKATA